MPKIDLSKEVKMPDFKKLNLKGKVSLKRQSDYPSKTTMNLLMKKTAAARVPYVVLYSLLTLALLTVVLKIAIFNPLAEYHAQQDYLAELQSELDLLDLKLVNYDAVAAEYQRYSYGYLSEAEAALVDRMQIVAMIDDCVGSQGTVKSISIADTQVTVSFEVAELDTTATIVNEIQKYPTVASVIINNATEPEGGTVSSNMVITMVGGAVGEGE